MAEQLQVSDTLKALSSSLATLRMLEWRVRHAVQSSLSGDYKSSFRGKGMEFDQVVKYEFGDDVRDIDWNVTARLGEPYRKKFVEEREITLILLFEDSPSLQFGSGSTSKRDALMELASLIMLLSAVNGDRVSLMYASPDGYEFSRSLNGRGRILHTAAHLLAKPAPRALSSDQVRIPWRYFVKAAPRHSVFVWLSDFCRIEEPEAWNIARKRYQPVGFRVEDPWERAIPKNIKRPIFDPQSGRMFTLDGGSAQQRKAQENWNGKRDEHFHRLFRGKSDRLTHQAGDDSLEGVVNLFHQRMKRLSPA